MSTAARFSDGQYKNWLKCSQSLIIMKEALHDYIDDEVKKLHGDITLKVSSTPCGSSTGNQCGSCSWKNIKLTGGNPRTWSINCKNSICDKWLHQILAVNDNPHNPTINWKNADISMWPTDCYQVAKIFMPKGQERTTKMPDDLDTPAILSLMKYCNWFRKELPNTQILSDLIEIRNKVLHTGDLRVADSDKDSWIDQMIHLLSDLNIHSDAQAELQMLKREDIDFNFQESEIRALHEMASVLASELTTLKGDMESLQNSQSDLIEDMEKLFDDTAETSRKVDALEADIEQIMKALEELKIIFDEMVSFCEENPDILDKQITETITNTGTAISDQQKDLFRVATALKARIPSRGNKQTKLFEAEKELLDIKAGISLLKMQKEKVHEENKNKIEKHQEETKKQRKEAKTNQEEIRLVAAEQKNNYEQKEAPRKKRPESDDLKLLKAQTEDKLDTLRRLGCISTKQAEKAKKLLEGKRSVVIRGNPGEGKTTMALHLIDNEIYRDKRVVLYSPQDWEKVDTDWVDIVVLEDVFGQYDFDPVRLEEWIVYLPTIQEQVDAGNLRVIVTTRVDLLSKAYSKLRSLKLFSDDLSLTLSSKQLTNFEKMSILNRVLYRHRRNMKEDEKEECISNFGGLIGFPQCCSLFAGDIMLFDRGPDFFRSPEKFFVANISKLEATGFLSLAFLFCNGEIVEENLSHETMPETSKHLLMELASHLNISEENASIMLLKDAYDSFLDLYVVKSMSHNFSLESAVKKPCISFTHSTVFEAVGQILGDHCPEMVVKYADSKYLYQKTYTSLTRDSLSQNVFIPLYLYALLAERMVYDVVEKGIVRSVVKHSAFRQLYFLMKLKNELHKGNRIKDFFIAGSYSESRFSHNLSQGKCITFLQYILQSDEDVVRLVYSQFLEFLACAHNISSDCWKCREKQNLLELALYFHHFQIADQLITMNAYYTCTSLGNAARHGDLLRVPTILETLKSSQVFNPECKEAKDALCGAFKSGNQSLIEMLLKEGITLDSLHVVDAVKHGDLNVLMKVVEHLKYYEKWNPHKEKHQMQRIPWHLFHSCISLGNTELPFQFEIPCSWALYITYCDEKFDMTDYLMKNEVKVSMYMLAHMSQYSSLHAVAILIQNLKVTDEWEPKSDAASEALANAYSKEKYDVCDLLVQEGVSLTMKNLPDVVGTVWSSWQTVEKAIQNLKDTDNWDAKSDDASEALANAYSHMKYDTCDLLVQEGISLTMKNLPDIAGTVWSSLKNVDKAIQNLKDTNSWDPKSDDASEALANAYSHMKYDTCDLLVQEGISLTMKNFPDIAETSLETVKKAIQNLKDCHNWDPKCDDASKALENSYKLMKHDVRDLLIQEGVLLTMKNLPRMVCSASFESIQQAIQHLKDNVNWNPRCDDASEALASAYNHRKYDVCDLLVEVRVSSAEKNLLGVLSGFQLRMEDIKKNYKEMQNKILQYNMSGLISVSTTLKGKMATLQTFMSYLSEEMEASRVNTTEMTKNINSVETDIETMRKSLDELKPIPVIVSFLDKIPGILDIESTKTIRTIGNDVQDLQEKLLDMEKELSRVSTLKIQMEPKEKVRKTEKNQEEIEKQVEEIKRRHNAIEEQKENYEQFSLQKVKLPVLSKFLVDQDIKLTCNDFPRLKEIISAGPNNEQARTIVDGIRKQDDTKLKTLLFWHLAELLTDHMASGENDAKFRIWPGTEHQTEKVKFVCLYKGKLKTQLLNFFQIDIHYRDLDIPAKVIDFKNCDYLNWQMSRDQGSLILHSAIEEYGDSLFKKHSNLQVICGGPFLLCEREQCVKKLDTIILYCHGKGMIPYGEESFPSLLTFNGIDVPVDIREGYFVLAVGRREWQETLSMGISIGENGKTSAGTIGPFVDLGDGRRGFLTCAHVVGEKDTEVVQPSEEDIWKEREQEQKICGTVVKRVFAPDIYDRMNGLTKTGVDAALVKLNTNRKLHPVDFPPISKSELNRIGFSPRFYGGCIGCPQEWERPVLKYGKTSGLRMGKMVLEGAMVKINDLELKCEKQNQNFILKGQFLIDRFKTGQFAEEGDSGAGVFMIDKENKMMLIGLVTGIISATYDYRCVVTPIEHILRVLELTPIALEKIQTDLPKCEI